MLRAVKYLDNLLATSVFTSRFPQVVLRFLQLNCLVSSECFSVLMWPILNISITFVGLFIILFYSACPALFISFFFRFSAWFIRLLFSFQKHFLDFFHLSIIFSSSFHYKNFYLLCNF